MAVLASLAALGWGCAGPAGEGPGRPEAPPAEAGPGADGEQVVAASARLRFVDVGRGLPRAGQWRDAFDVADLDGDGHLDLVHGPPRKAPGPPRVFRGDGQGGWQAWREARFPRRPYDYGDAKVADLDGDGRADVVLAVHLRGLIALLGDGRGGFVEASRGLPWAGSGAGAETFSSRAIRLADWDGDGRPDIVALGEGPRIAIGPGGGRAGPGGRGVHVFLNAPAPPGLRWVHRPPPAAGPPGLFGSSLGLGDFDGDGRMDAVTGSSVVGRTDLVNLARADLGWTPVPVDGVRPRSVVWAVAAADLDGDRRSDVVLAYASLETGAWRAGIDALLARPGGVWARRPLWSRPGRDGAWAVATGDVDGDGRVDVVALTGDGAAWIFLGDGRGRFTREAAMPRFGGRCRGSHVILADLDGDGRAELVASFAEEPTPGEPDRCPGQGGLAAWRPVVR